MDEQEAANTVAAISTATRMNTIGRSVIDEANTTCPISCAAPTPNPAPASAPISAITAVSNSMSRDTAPSVAPIALSNASSRTVP